LGERKDIWPVKTSVSKPLGDILMLVNESGRCITLYSRVQKVCMRMLRIRMTGDLRINGANPGLPGQRPLKWYVNMYFQQDCNRKHEIL